jgi:hypothetical protein
MDRGAIYCGKKGGRVVPCMRGFLVLGLYLFLFWVFPCFVCCFSLGVSLNFIEFNVLKTFMRFEFPWTTVLDYGRTTAGIIFQLCQR